MTKKIKASFTNNPLEYAPGDKVIQIYPVARPLVGVVVGANKVEGKVYVNWNGRTQQVDPEEIQLAMGSTFFPIGRTASKSDERKFKKILAALSNSGKPNESLKFHIDFEKNLIAEGISPEEAEDISHAYQDTYAKRFGCYCLDPVPPVCGEPVVVLNECGSKPGAIGILVATEGTDAVVDLSTSWSPTSNGSQLFRAPMISVVPVQGSLRERLNNSNYCASVSSNKDREVSNRTACQAFDLFMSSVKNVDVYDIKDLKAWVQTSCDPCGDVIVSAVVEKGGECDPLMQRFPIFSQKLSGFNVRNATDYKNAVQRIVPLIENCKSSILQYCRENIIPNYVEEELKRSLTAKQKMFTCPVCNDCQVPEKSGYCVKCGQNVADKK
jgi:hypothetical protein